MRLMASEPGAETPIDKYVRFKRDIRLWYKEMDDFGLTKEEQKTLEPYFKSSYGVPPSQEQLMLMLMDKNICGFSLAESNAARKTVAKKQMDKIPALHEKIVKQASSEKLGQYVWKYGAGPQMGYSFSVIHALAYSFIAMQTLYLATHFNPIYWDTACLIVNSGSLDDSSTDYVKVAKAIGSIQQADIQMSLVNINKSELGFIPDVENNRIMFGLKGMTNVGEEIIQEIIANRPYASPKDFVNKINPKRQVMISLIKGGAFDEMMDRKLCMGWYIWETCDKKKRLTLQNMSGLIKHNLLPETKDEEVMARRIYEFNRYLKAVCKDTATFYKLDERAIEFLTEIGQDNLIQSGCELDQKIWDKKVYQPWMDVFRNWISENKDEILANLNNQIFLEDWNKYAKGNYSTWEMETLCFYYHTHELAGINAKLYGLFNFNQLPEEPVVERTFNTKDGKQINIFKLYKICGTCIAKNKAKGTVTLLTPDGIAEVKFRREYFSLFDKQISERQPDGTKKVVEKSWFNRGSMIVVQGFRSGSNFIPKKYSTSSGHQLYKIQEVLSNGELILQDARHQGDLEDEA